MPKYILFCRRRKVGRRTIALLGRIQFTVIIIAACRCHIQAFRYSSSNNFIHHPRYYQNPTPSAPLRPSNVHHSPVPEHTINPSHQTQPPPSTKPPNPSSPGPPGRPRRLTSSPPRPHPHLSSPSLLPSTPLPDTNTPVITRPSLSHPAHFAPSRAPISSPFSPRQSQPPRYRAATRNPATPAGYATRAIRRRGKRCGKRWRAPGRSSRRPARRWPAPR